MPRREWSLLHCHDHVYVLVREKTARLVSVERGCTIVREVMMS
jgi:hypothetical protein